MDPGVKVILLESVFKSLVDTLRRPNGDGQAVCGHTEILSQTLCKRYMNMDIPNIPLSHGSPSISHTPTCAEHAGPEVLREVNV